MPGRMSWISLVTLVSSWAAAADVKFADGPRAEKAGEKVNITFVLSAKADVEVAVVDSQGKVVRHLAAGVAGGESRPPLPLKAGLSQSVEWDGKDDYGQPVADAAALSLRVRAGMGVKLDRIVGGDPYAFVSREMGWGDHAAWRITGMDVKPDGTVYVMGNVNNYGPPAIRQYDAEGTYRRTVYPFPAGKPIEDVRGWCVTSRPDGAYTPLYSDLSSPALSKTPIASTRGGCARLLSSPENATLTISPLSGWSSTGHPNTLMTVGVDGSLRENRLTPLFADAPAPKDVFGPFSCAHSPDGKTMYVTGLFACEFRNGQLVGVQTSGYWRDGQVWKVDVATRKATVFFALDEKDIIGDMKARAASPIAHLSKYCQYGAFHGVAVDGDGNVLVGDRQNKRIVALDKDGKVIREIAVMYADALALEPASRALYVTTRTGDCFTKGEVRLLKFADWTKDPEPVANLVICPSYGYSPNSFLGVCKGKTDTLIWVAYTPLPVRIYRDRGKDLELAKDFYEAGPQRALDLQHIVVDPKTEHVYVSDGWGRCFRIADWKNLRFVQCMQDAKTPLSALSLAIDARGRKLYGHADRKPVARYRMDGEFFPLDTGGGALTSPISNDWRIGLGFGDRGLAVAPDGSVATLGALGTGPDYSGPLHFFKADPAKTLWEPLFFKEFGKPRSGGIRFDPRGNLYVGKYDGNPKDPPTGFEKDSDFLGATGRIYKYAPTGSLAGGNLFPSEPAEPAKIYDIHYGSIGPHFSRTPRFGVDGFGRIYYPTSLEPRVSVIDNEGNAILNFGTYGNRDSTGGLEGDLVPTKDIPLGWPNSVDATDDYIYVSDIVNIRLLRIAKTFAAAETVGVK